MYSNSILLAAAGGFLPIIIWLAFWLREDSHPEPKRNIGIVFILGAVGIAIALPLQAYTRDIFQNTLILFIIWAVIEEVIKFAAAYLGGIRSKAFNEPMDAVIYLITAALGYAALENTLFLVNPLLNGDLLLGFLIGNIRFVGATLLHTIASGVLGVAIALAFFRRKQIKYLYTIIGVILAVVLHTAFNIFIIESAGQSDIFAVFASVWFAILIFLLVMEKVKRIRPRFLTKK